MKTNKQKRVFLPVAFLTLLMVLSITLSVAAKTDPAGNVFTDKAEAEKLDVKGDYHLFSAGTANAEGNIAGDILFATGESRFSGTVGGSVRGASMSLDIKNLTARNLTVAATTLLIDEKSQFEGIYCFGGMIEFYGQTKQLSIASAMKVTLGGKIVGKADITTDQLIISSTADLSALESIKLTSEAKPLYYNFESNEELAFPDELMKKIEIIKPPSMAQKIASQLQLILPATIAGALVFSWLLSGQLDRAKSRFEHTPGRVIGLGFGGQIGGILLCFILLMIPYINMLGIVLMLALIILYIVSTAFASASFGRLMFPKLNKTLASVICATLAGVLSVLPYLGGLLALFTTLYTIGNATLALFDKDKNADSLPPLDVENIQV